MKVRIFLIFLMSLLSLVGQAFANPASELKLDYDLASKTLHINVVHISTNIHKHYIRNIEVSLNGTLVKNIRLVTQDTNRELKQDITVNAKVGDVINVKTICNQAGIKEASIKIEIKDVIEEKPASIMGSKKAAQPAAHRTDEETPRPYSTSY